MNLSALYKRWRHTRGFGVHSPFAYRMVTEVVHPRRGYAYYAELDPGMDRDARLAYRLEIFLRNEKEPTLHTVGSTSNGRNVKRNDRRGSGMFLREWLRKPLRSLLIFNPGYEETESISKAMEKSGTGLLLLSRRYLIAVPRKEMAFIRYEIL